MKYTYEQWPEVRGKLVTVFHLSNNLGNELGRETDYVFSMYRSSSYLLIRFLRILEECISEVRIHSNNIVSLLLVECCALLASGSAHAKLEARLPLRYVRTQN